MSYLLLADRVIDPLDDTIGSGTSICTSLTSSLGLSNHIVASAFLPGIIACILSNTQAPGKTPWATEADKMGRLGKILDKISSLPPTGSSARSFLSGKITLPQT